FILRIFLPLPFSTCFIKKQQQDVLGFLEANKIEFEEKDIAANEENRKWMRENVPEDSRPASGNPLPPRLFNDSRYLGDYEAFFEARENNAVYAFLGLTAPPGSKTEAVLGAKLISSSSSTNVNGAVRKNSALYRELQRAKLVICAPAS
uniref:SH3 domain-binding glutamic acid-rich-like protein 1 n=1 Tax=Accipiter nisus TaxID=211598 RepID=A0A8B9MB92_9AVES